MAIDASFPSFHTFPTSPSAVTSTASGWMPSRVPAESRSVPSEPGPASRSVSAGTKL